MFEHLFERAAGPGGAWGSVPPGPTDRTPPSPGVSLRGRPVAAGQSWGSLVRSYAEPVEVSRRDEAPEQFLWRGRLHLVREVVARWTEAGRWWESGAGRALVGGDADGDGGARPGPLDTAPIPSSPKWAQRAWGEPAPDVGAAAGPLGVDDGEREFWRVEAAAGRSAEPGVYDLCFDWSRGQWSLSRVLD